MSIYIKDKKEAYHEMIVPHGAVCFLCGDKISKAGIHWMGSAGDEVTANNVVYFHPHCAMSFCRRILEDCERYYSPDPTTPIHNVPNPRK